MLKNDYVPGDLVTSTQLNAIGNEAITPDLTHAATSKATPVDADEIPLVDSAGSFGLKKLTWANIKATLAMWLGALPSGSTIAVHNQADQTTNYERLRGFWSSDVFNLKTENGGTGTIRDLVVGASTLAVATFRPGGNFARIALNGNSSAATGISVQQVGTLNASSGVQRGLLASPAVNQTGTAGYTALGVDVTETTTGSGAKKLIDAAVGGATKFAVDTAGNIELGHATDTTLSRSAAGKLAVEGVDVVLLSGAQILTGKALTPRVTTVTSSATPTFNTDNIDALDITTLTTAITSMTSGRTGTLVNFQRLLVRISSASAQAIAWGTDYVAGSVALPTTTVAGKILMVGFIVDTAGKLACEASGSRA